MIPQATAHTSTNGTVRKIVQDSMIRNFGKRPKTNIVAHNVAGL
jgi:hypothetical protein